MSRNKRKKSLGAQSQVAEKYLESYLRSVSDDTVQEKPSKGTEGNLAATNEDVPSDSAGINTNIKPTNVFKIVWNIIGIVVILVAFVGGIWAIGWYFWNLDQRVSNTSGKIDRIEIALNQFSTETKEWQGKIVYSVTELRNKLHTLIKQLSREDTSKR